MSLSLNPGALSGFAGSYELSNNRPRPVVEAPRRPEPAADETQQTQRVRRSENYVAALRELREQQQEMRRSPGAQTYLDIAHFDGGFQLIDVYA